MLVALQTALTPVWALYAAYNLSPTKTRHNDAYVVPAEEFGAHGSQVGKETQSNVAQMIQDAKGHLALEQKWTRDPLSRPKVDLIPASDIREYPYTDRYLDLDDKEVSHYFILKEDYVFRNLDGRFDKIPAGFIWDGASIPKNVLKIVPVWVVLETGNTRYASALSEGLIHDYMYRNPQRYTKKMADELLYDNLIRCKNPDPMKIYQGVDKFGDSSYLGHWRNQKQGRYDAFTEEFYANNLKIHQSGRTSRKLPALDRDPQCGKEVQLEDQVCRDEKATFVDDSKTMDVADANKVDSSVGIGVRGWCRCGGKKDKGCCCGYGAILGASATDCPYVYTLCKRCGKCVRDPDNLFDVKVEVALQKAKNMTTSQFLAERKKAQARLLAIPDGQIVIPGKCVCEKPDVIKAGSLDGKEFYVCLLCGRCYVPVNNTVPIGPTARSEMGLK